MYVKTLLEGKIDKENRNNVRKSSFPLGQLNYSHTNNAKCITVLNTSIELSLLFLAAVNICNDLHMDPFEHIGSLRFARKAIIN